MGASLSESLQNVEQKVFQFSFAGVALAFQDDAWFHELGVKKVTDAWLQKSTFQIEVVGLCNRIYLKVLLSHSNSTPSLTGFMCGCEG